MSCFTTELTTEFIYIGMNVNIFLINSAFRMVMFGANMTSNMYPFWIAMGLLTDFIAWLSPHCWVENTTGEKWLYFQIQIANPLLLICNMDSLCCMPTCHHWSYGWVRNCITLSMYLYLIGLDAIFMCCILYLFKINMYSYFVSWYLWVKSMHPLPPRHIS